MTNEKCRCPREKSSNKENFVMEDGGWFSIIFRMPDITQGC